MGFNYKLFSKDIVKKRKLDSIPLRELQKITGVKAPSVSRIENCIGHPDIRTFAALLVWLNEPANKYFGQPYEGQKFEEFKGTLYKKIN